MKRKKDELHEYWGYEWGDESVCRVCVVSPSGGEGGGGGEEGNIIKGLCV